MAIVGSTERVGDRVITILAEVEGDVSQGAVDDEWGEPRETRAEKVMDATRDVFGDGLALARDCATRAVENVRDEWRDVSPAEFEIQLAIKFDAEAGAVLAKVAAGAQMQVTMRWK
jgi:hypothetical protein